jgi:hypothetical protein
MIDPAQDRYRWQTFVNAVMNLLVPQHAGDSLDQQEVLLVSQRLWFTFRYAPYNDVAVNEVPRIRRWSRKIIIS